MLLFPSSSMPASATTRAETTGACVARFPVAGSLPRYLGGSASASCFSRPARRLLAFSPAWSLNRLTRPFDARVLQSISLPPRTALAATNRSDSCCAQFAPARRNRLSTAHNVEAIKTAEPRSASTASGIVAADPAPDPSQQLGGLVPGWFRSERHPASATRSTTVAVQRGSGTGS